jgi:hypothetical protein
MAKAKKDGVNKMEAVRQIIKTHGKDTSANDLVKYMKAEHGADMTVGMAYTYKATALKQLGLTGGGKGKKGPKPGPKPAAASANGEKKAPKAGGISLDDITAVKKLVEQMGAEKVRQLAVVLGK